MHTIGCVGTLRSALGEYTGRVRRIETADGARLVGEALAVDVVEAHRPRPNSIGARRRALGAFSRRIPLRNVGRRARAVALELVCPWQVEMLRSQPLRQVIVVLGVGA